MTHRGRDPKDTIAYFPEADSAKEGGDILNPLDTDYNWKDLDDLTNVKLQSVNSNGWNSETSPIPTAIAVAHAPDGFTHLFTGRPFKAVTKEDFFTTLVHEVQHAADRHYDTSLAIEARLAKLGRARERVERAYKAVKSGEEFDPADLKRMPPPVAEAFVNMRENALRNERLGDENLTAAEEYVNANSRLTRETRGLALLERYKTEFRAYSYEGTYNKYDNNPFTGFKVPDEFSVYGYQWTERQYRIFRQIYLGYEHTKEGWDEDVPVGGGRTFRQEVLDYRDPDEGGANKWNSPRINTVNRRLRRIPTGTIDPNAPVVTELLKGISVLTWQEADYLRNEERRKRDFTNLLESRLTGPARKAVYDALDARIRG